MDEYDEYGYGDLTEAADTEARLYGAIAALVLPGRRGDDRDD